MERLAVSGRVLERPTIRQLEYAVAVADAGHFGRAAEQCHVSQPALSAQIRELEQRLGLTLFERGRHGAKVAPDAADAIAAARRVLAEVDELVRVVDDRADDLVGRVALGVIPTMAPYLLPTVVRVTRDRYQNARLALREERTVDLVASLTRGDLDLALLAAPVPDVGRLTVVELAVDPFLVALPVGHPLAGDSPIAERDLSDLPMLLLEDGHCLRDQAISACESIGAGTAGEIQATGLPSLCQMVAAGMGATLLPASAVEVETRPGSGLTVRPLRSPGPSRTVALAWRVHSPRARFYASLADALREPISDACQLSALPAGIWEDGRP